MTKRHFEAVAARIKAVRSSYDDELEANQIRAIDRVARELAVAFRAFNPAFSTARFLEACGVENA